MSKLVVYEVFEVTADSVEAAREQVLKDTAHKKSVVVAATSLAALAHPVHLHEVQLAFGSIGSSKK